MARSFSSFPAVGFSGDRYLPALWAPLVALVVSAVESAGRSVFVGDASGADAFVLAAARSPVVFRVPRRRGFAVPRGAFAARSCRLVVAVSRAACPGSAFVGFAVSPCPSGVFPAPRWCSGARPSGTWSSLAFAAGLGLPVFVFWCGPARPLLPAWPGGVWVPSPSSGVWAAAWRWSPAR